MIGAVLAPVLDSGLDTPFGCVDGLRGLVGVSCGNLQTSRVELLLMFLHPGLLDLTELRIADRRTQRGEGERAAVVRRGSTADSLNVSPKLVVIVRHENRARAVWLLPFPIAH